VRAAMSLTDVGPGSSAWSASDNRARHA